MRKQTVSRIINGPYGGTRLGMFFGRLPVQPEHSFPSAFD